MNNFGHRDSHQHKDSYTHYNRRDNRSDSRYDAHRREPKNITGTVARITSGRFFISDTEGVLAKDEARIALSGAETVKPDRDGNITCFGFCRDRDGFEFIAGDTVAFTAERGADKFSGKPIYKAQRVNLVKASEAEFPGLLQYSFIEDEYDENAVKTLFITSNEFGRLKLPFPESGWFAEKPGNDGIVIDFKLQRRGNAASGAASNAGFTPVITNVHGDGGCARTCADALFYPRKVGVDFSADVTSEAEKVSSEFEKGLTDSRLSDTENRLDLRDTVIFTIDGKDTKDIDDAISLYRFADAPDGVKALLHKNGGPVTGEYLLGVHIADVSHFVKTDGNIWKEAAARTTSEYIADRVLPMLPPCLSNGVCSLNPNEDRFALSALMSLDGEGELTDFAFAKTVIRSRVKGVYSELNELHNAGFSEDFQGSEKYNECLPTLKLLDELLVKLRVLRQKRCALPLETTECKIVCDDNGRVVDLVPRSSSSDNVAEIPANSGYSEELVEECMVLANRAAAKFSVKSGLAEKSGSSLPVYLYRSHAAPDVDKLKMLHETLTSVRLISGGMKFSALASRERLSEILGRSRGTNLKYIVNMAVLRAQMKASYTNALIGHFGLALHEYSHFTSPIRRFADLVIHHIISDVVSGKDLREIMRKYRKITEDAAKTCSQREIVAVKNERQCESFYKAEYMSRYKPTVKASVELDRPREIFDGIISGFPPSENGFFVVLPNTAEGFVPLIRQGFKLVQGGTELYCEERGITYRIGDDVKVAVERVSIPTGKIDFCLV